MFSYNLKRAFRNLWKNKFYSLLIFGGFSIGFAAAILIGLFYFTEKRVNKDFPNYKRIYRLYDAGTNECLLNWDMYPILAEKYPEIEDVCPLECMLGAEILPLSGQPILKNEQLNTYTHVRNFISTTNNFFNIFNVEVVEKSAEKPFPTKESIILTRSVAKNLFGSINPLGQKVNLDNYIEGTVSGLINDLPPNSSFKADIF